jgi:hypothetical protein
MQTYAITNNHGVSQTKTGDRPPVNMTENEKSPMFSTKMIETWMENCPLPT